MSMTSLLKKLATLSAFTAVLLTSSSGFSEPNQVLAKSLGQLDTVMESAPAGTAIIWQRRSFSSDEDAQIMLDVLRLAAAWNTWFRRDGTDVTYLMPRIKILLDNPIDMLDQSQRAELIRNWFSQHLDNNDALAAHGDMLLSELPKEFDFVGGELHALFRHKEDEVADRVMRQLEQAEMARPVLAIAPASSQSTVKHSCERLFIGRPALRLL